MENIYSERFAYNTAKNETGCDKYISRADCPALRIERMGATHPLFALAYCAQCRRKLAQKQTVKAR